MDLPVMPPVRPMLAKLSRDLPVAGDMLYEPKWDGFRCIVFRDGEEVELGSRNERPLTRYFPELPPALVESIPERCVLDGEIVIAGDNGLEFEALLQRIHPAPSRIRRLAAETPASFVAFDILALGVDDLRSRPFRERRALLESALDGVKAPIHLTPATTDPGVAAQWFDQFEGAGLDGVVAKTLDLPYREGDRSMLKVKHLRSADCVVGGFRWHKAGPVVGSLLLGLYDPGGDLHHVGVASGFSAALRDELTAFLEPYRDGALDGHPWREWATAAALASESDAAGTRTRMPGGQSRWNAGRDMSWEPIRLELVAEVAYDHLQGDRFRHATKFLRWRPDRGPASCTYDQLETAVPEQLSVVFGS